MQILSDFLAYVKKFLYLCTRFDKIRRRYLRTYRKIQGCNGVILGY